MAVNVRRQDEQNESSLLLPTGRLTFNYWN